MFDNKPADLLRALEWALPYAERAHRAEYGDADTDTAASVQHARAALAAALAAAGKPRAVEDDGYNVVILARGTREPVFALAYGESQT